MLTHCANPGCCRRFRKLEAGKLFLVEVCASDASLPCPADAVHKLDHPVEHYWLCDACASFLTLSFEQERGVVTVALPRPLGKKPAAGSVEVLAPGSTTCDSNRGASGEINEA